MDSVSHPESTPKPFPLIPFSRDPDFVPRGDLLGRIQAQCAQPGGRAALVGLGGVADVGCGGTWVFWVHAGTRARVEEGFRAIADAVKLPDRHLPKADVLRLLYSWLSNEKNGRWLLVLDSADDYEVFYGAEPGKSQPLASYLPQSPNGAILVTTRDHGLAVRLTGNYRGAIQVGPMTPDEAILFLEKKLGVSSEPELAAELVATLDCIPLAINQAASYIQARSPRCTMQKYLVEFRESEKKSAKLLAHDAAELRRDGSASNAIMKTWQISFDHICSKQPSAADLLSLMSFFDYQSIPESALNPENEYDSDFDSDLESNGDTEELANEFSTLHLLAAKKKQNQIPSNSEFDSDSDSDDDSFEDDVSMLRNFCLVSVTAAGNQFEMHRLVQLATRKWLAVTKRHERFRQLFIHRVFISMPSPDTYNIFRFRQIIVHMQIAASYRPNKATTRAWCAICNRLSWLRYVTGLSSEAREPLDKAYTAWRERKGPEHTACLEYRRLLGDILLELDQIFEAEGIINEVLEIARKTVGEDNESTIVAMISLAEIYVRQGRYDEAETLEVCATEAAKRALGPEDHRTLTYLACLSRTYMAQGRSKEAENISQAALETCKRVFGPTDYETLEFMAVLAGTYEHQERYEDALQLELNMLKVAQSAPRPDNLLIAKGMSRLSNLYRSKHMYEHAEEMDKAALVLSTKELGPSHPATLGNLTDLAYDYHEQGRKEEAIIVLHDVIERATSEHGRDHAYTITCMDSAAIIFFKQRDYTTAEEFRTHILSYRRRTLGDAHPDTISAMAHLARIFRHHCKFEEAISLFEEALSGSEAKFGFEHKGTLQIARNVASIYSYGLERHSEAISILKRVSNTSKAAYGAEAELTLQSMLALSECQQKAGLLVDAESLQRFVLTTRKSGLGPQHKDTLEAMYSLADTLEDGKRFEEAAVQFREVLSGYNSCPDSTGIWAAMAAEALGRNLVSCGKFEEALGAFTEAFCLFQETLGGDDPSTLTCLSWKGHVYAEQERWTEAAEEYAHVLEVRKNVLGPNERSTLFTMRRLAVALSHADELEKALAVLSECVDRARQHLGPEDPDTLEFVELLADALEDDEGSDTPNSSVFEDCPIRDGPEVTEIVGDDATGSATKEKADQTGGVED
ncbi:Tetratricopeptide-like helical [Cordyceps fumosorosea ARSEF 2679]|uniref:Tetratricopeptide-like helical n=1 Tax=Cordyceps fumosorosea (strain ARSEF 2679) TaxID=1081104 RepID=A0A167MQA9_CORFA|nr:Tetratricopeptide-like helical [Cordyceps fumosorosea ARSEF 2679]OAA54637.1 Tetratricopeptide-like helical [Cordyceps fumosorosea ARSEF 2679]